MHAAAQTRPDPGLSDAALVLAARAGEPWATEALFRRHAAMAAGLALRLMGRDDDLDDLVQDSFVEALSNLRRLRDPAAFAGWLRAIVVHRAHKLIRRRRVAARLGLGRAALQIDAELLISHVAPADVATELGRVYRAVARLPTDLRIALVLRRVEGLTLEEIADLTQASLATVKRRIKAAELRLTTEKP